MHERARKLIEEFKLPLPGTLPWNFPAECDCFCVDEQLPCFYSPDEALIAAIQCQQDDCPDEFYDVWDVEVHGYIAGGRDDTNFVDTLAELVCREICENGGHNGEYYVSPVPYGQLKKDIEGELAGLYRRLGLLYTKPSTRTGTMRVSSQCVPPKYMMSLHIVESVNDADSELVFREQLPHWLQELCAAEPPEEG